MKRWTISLLCLLLVVGPAMEPTYAQRKKRNIRVVATGGGIAGALSSKTKGKFSVGNLSVHALTAQVPELRKMANVTGEQLVNIPSQAMSDEIWLKLAKRVNQILSSSKYDAVVITHGTDTMEETAYFLNLVVKSKKPVVMVGAVRPYNHLSPDGPSNLYDAVVLAANSDTYRKGVLITMNGKILDARSAIKRHTYGPDGMQAPETGILGYVHASSVRFYNQPARRHTYRSDFSVKTRRSLPRVDIIYGYANDARHLVDAAIRGGAKGIVYAGVGNGNVHPETLKGLIDAQKQGIQVVRASRTGDGMVTRGAEISDAKYNFVVADNLSPQKARVLLKLALTKGSNPKRIQRYFDTY